jgi:hypothetical protein
MKTKVKEQILAFMKKVDTSDMSSNIFIKEYLYYMEWLDIQNCNDFEYMFDNCPSVESLTRARRYTIATHWIWKRKQADTQAEYISAYWLKNKIHIV